MCGRVYLKTNLEGLLQAFSFAKREGAEGLANQLPRFNGARSQYDPIIIRDVIRVERTAWLRVGPPTFAVTNNRPKRLLRPSLSAVFLSAWWQWVT